MCLASNRSRDPDPRADEIAGGGNDAGALKPSDDSGRQTELDLSSPAGALLPSPPSPVTRCLSVAWMHSRSHVLLLPPLRAGTLPAAAYSTKFITTHKAACRVAKFNSDGKQGIVSRYRCSNVCG